MPELVRIIHVSRAPDELQSTMEAKTPMLPRIVLALLVLSPLPTLASDDPRLVLTIVVDQFRYDYLSRHQADFTDGLRTLLDHGAVFTNAHYEAMPTVTAVGHSTVLSGAMPAVSGIAGNSWYSVDEGRNVQSITDTDVMPLGGGREGASPKRLLVSTIGDELKASGRGGKVYGVSLKDRGAILPSGHAADAAYWVNAGQMVSSSWYFPALPAWVQSFNAGNPALDFAGQSWTGGTLPGDPEQLLRAMDATPFADQLVLDFTLQLMAEEELGQDEATDLLTVSFSAMDYLGHASGPDTAAMRAMVLSVDRKIGQLIAAAEAAAGRDRLLVVFTADHGVAPLPETSRAHGLPAGRFDGAAARQSVEDALEASFGDGDYVLSASEGAIYLNRFPVPGRFIPYEQLELVTAETLRNLPLVTRVYTRSDLERGLVSGDRIDERVRNGFNDKESGDLIIVHQAYWLGMPAGTNHGSPYNYDSHVPLIFMGPASLLRPGRYHAATGIQDLAPTLATMLGIATPTGSQGRVLTEILP